MKVVGFAGFSGAGKTTLVEQLIPVLRQWGLRVSVVKHVHHGFEIDHPGKDTWRHREAGAYEVVAASPQRLVLMREFERPVELTVHDVIRTLHPGVDWVLVEGYRDSNLLKVEVWRAVHRRPGSRRHRHRQLRSIAADHPAPGAEFERRRCRGRLAARQ